MAILLGGLIYSGKVSVRDLFPIALPGFNEKVVEDTRSVQLYSPFDDFSDVSTVVWNSTTEAFRFTYTLNDNYWIEIQPTIIHTNGTEYNYSHLKASFPNIDMQRHIQPKRFKHKYAIEFTNISQGVINNVDKFRLRLTDWNGLTLQDFKRQGNATIRIKNKVILDFSDLVASNFTLTVPDSFSVDVGNLQYNYNATTKSLLLDPEIQFEGATTNATFIPTGSSSRSFLHDSGSNNNSLLLVFVYHNGGFGNNLNTVTYGGTSMTLVGAPVSGDLAAWFLVDPASGSNNVTMSFSGGSGVNVSVTASALTYFNVNQTDSTYGYDSILNQGAFSSPFNTQINITSETVDDLIIGSSGVTEVRTYIPGHPDQIERSDISSNLTGNDASHTTGQRNGTSNTSVQLQFNASNSGNYELVIFGVRSVNSPPTTPTEIECNANTDCNITVDTTVDLNASGSTDVESDTITYFIEATLENTTIVTDGTDVSKTGEGAATTVTGQWRDTAGTFDATPTVNVWTGFPFDTEDSSHANYTQNANDIDVDIGVTGHYLVLYGVHLTTAYTNRLGHESRLTLGGVAVNGSYSSSYTRDSTDNEGFLSGGAIISATAGQDVRVEIVYRTSNGNQVITPVANDSYLQIIQLDDTWDYFRARETTGTSMSEASWNQITWEVADEEDTGSFNHTSDAIELKTTGHYLIVAGYGVAQSTSRGSFLIRATLNGNPIETSYGYEFIRDTNAHEEGNPMFFTLIEATADDVLRIEARHDFETSTGSVTTLTDKTGVMVVALPEGDYYRGYGNDTINPSVSTSYTLLDMIDVEVEEGSSSFDGDALGTVNIEATSDYLIFFTGEGTRATTINGTRDTTQVRLFVTGAESTFGGGWYDRGDQATTGTFEGGTSFGVYSSLTDTDNISFSGREVGGNGNGRFSADQYGITIVNFNALLTGSGAVNETNTSATDYSDVNADFVSVDNITVKVEIDSYDPRASVSQSTNDPDLFLEIWNGTDWISIGSFNLNVSYTGSGLNTTNANFSLITTDSGILSAWETSTNQDLRIKGIFMDHNGTLPDEINFTNVFIEIADTKWIEIGNHTESTNLTWNTTDLVEQTEINLRARAIDLAGSNTFSAYFTKNSVLNISHGAVEDTTAPQWFNNLTNSTVAGQTINHSVNWTDNIALANYTFSFDNGTGTFVNDSVVIFIGTQNFSNVIKGVNTTVGSTIRWRVYARDNSSNQNITDIFTYDTTSLDTCSPATPLTADYVYECSDNCNVTSNIDAAGFDILINGTGTFDVDGANISDYGTITIRGQDSSNTCKVRTIGGGFKD